MYDMMYYASLYQSSVNYNHCDYIYILFIVILTTCGRGSVGCVNVCQFVFTVIYSSLYSKSSPHGVCFAVTFTKAKIILIPAGDSSFCSF